MNEYYVYQYLREDLTPYYIGKGKGPRAWKHFKNEVQPPVDKSRVVIVAKELTDFEARILETRLIDTYGRKDTGTGILRNRTAGGEGASGRIPSTAAKEKSSRSNKETWATEDTISAHKAAMRDVWTSSERNSKISASLKGEKNPRFGKPATNRGVGHSEETKRKMAEAWAKRKAAQGS